jgi:hypothetical protein
MIKLKNILLEFQGKTLHVYDFDDTIVQTQTSVIIVEPSGNKRELNSHEFATYVPKPGEKIDFTQFDKIIKSSTPVQPNMEQLRSSLNNPNIRTTILTARRVAFPIMKHLRDRYNMNVYVVGVGSPNPELKADYIENEVKKGYTTVKYMDDSEKNLSAVAARLRRYSINLELIDAKTGKLVSI